MSDRKTMLGVKEIKGVMNDTLEKLSGGDCREWLLELKKFLRKEACWERGSKNGGIKGRSIIHLLSASDDIIIPACDGSVILEKAEDIFGYIDFDFKNWGLDKPERATVETAVQVYEMVKDATFVQMFSSLGVDLDKLCLSQHQIEKFCREYRDWLRTDGYATLFLFKVRDQFFVACVRVGSGSLRVSAGRFEDDDVWFAVRRHRVVVPQLDA